MSLIRCASCRRKISSLADACPRYGCPAPECFGWSPCSCCDGTGKCSHCGGQGRDPIRRLSSCKWCDGYDRCQYCGGTGKEDDSHSRPLKRICVMCHGSCLCPSCGGTKLLGMNDDYSPWRCQNCNSEGHCPYCKRVVGLTAIRRGWGWSL